MTPDAVRDQMIIQAVEAEREAPRYESETPDIRPTDLDGLVGFFLWTANHLWHNNDAADIYEALLEVAEEFAGISGREGWSHDNDTMRWERNWSPVARDCE